MRFYDVSVNRSVATEANRGLTSYTFTALFKTDLISLHEDSSVICVEFRSLGSSVAVGVSLLSTTSGCEG
jgi:hypothetical protein